MNRGLNEDQYWRRRSEYLDVSSCCHNCGLKRQASPTTTEQTQLPQSYSDPAHSMVHACHNDFSRSESPLTVLTSTSEGRWTKGRGVDEDDWSIYRSIIEQLYIGEDVHLKDVIKIMEKRFNFKATPKMYKTHFCRWKVGKNYKASQKADLAELAKLYHDSGRPVCTMKLGSQPVKLHRVRRFCKDRNIMADFSGHLPTRPASSIMIESGSPLGAFQLPNELAAREMVQPFGYQPRTSFEAIQTARVYTFDRPFSLTSSVGRIELVLLQTRNYFDRISSPDDAASLLSDLPYKLQIAVALLAQRKFREGWKCIDDACWTFHEIVHRPPLHLVRTILNAFGNPRWQQCPELKARILSFFATASIARLGCHHPLSIILFHLQEEAICFGAIEPAYEFLMKRFKGGKDLPPDEVWLLKSDFVDLLMRRDEHARASFYVQQFLDETKAWWGKQHSHTTSMLYLLAFSHYQQGFLDVAAAGCKEIIKQGIDSVEAGISSSKFVATENPSIYQLLAWISERRGDVVQSQQYWVEVLIGSAEIWGRQNDITTMYVEVAARSLANQGIDAQAWLQHNLGWSLGTPRTADMDAGQGYR